MVTGVTVPQATPVRVPEKEVSIDCTPEDVPRLRRKSLDTDNDGHSCKKYCPNCFKKIQKG